MALLDVFDLKRLKLDRLDLASIGLSRLDLSRLDLAQLDISSLQQNIRELNIAGIDVGKAESTARLHAFLLMMFLQMKRAERNNTAFIGKLQGRQMIIQIRTVSGRVARWFEVRDNSVRTGIGLHDSPTATLNFANSSVGLKAFHTRDKTFFMRSMQEGSLKVEGNMGDLMWLLSVGKYLRPRRRKPGEK